MCFTPFLCLTRHCCTRGASRPFRLTYTLHGRHRAVKRVYVIDSTIKTDFFLTFLSFFHSFTSSPKPSVLCLLCMHVSSPPHSLFRLKRAGCSSEANTLHRGGRGERELYITILPSVFPPPNATLSPFALLVTLCYLLQTPPVVSLHSTRPPQYAMRNIVVVNRHPLLSTPLRPLPFSFHHHTNFYPNSHRAVTSS